MSTAIDHTQPKGKWTFDDDVTQVFENMLARSIPQYDVMRQLCFQLGAKFAQRDTWIVDLGCSRGDALVPLIDKFGAHNRYLGVEISEPMLAAARERFAGMIQTGIVEVRALDLRKQYPQMKASVTQSILTLQFVPIEYRQMIVQNAFDHLLPGGAFILVEKILGATAKLDALMVESYLDMKREHGYSSDEIERKRLALEGVLVPITARWNEELLHEIGFSEIDCFWRWMNFAGWVAVKR
jgi:tRNA (cmo5U34)-methyltransferase